VQRGTRRDVEDELRRVLPERVAAGVVCSVIGAGVGPVGILLAGDRRWALAFFGLFTAVTALLTTFADLVPMRDGADAAQPAPAAPKAAGGMRSHLAGGARAVAAVAAMAAIASGHGGGNPLSRLAGVLLGAGLCSLASARWIASWERRTGQILLVGPAPKRARKPRAPTSPGGRKVRDVAEIHRRMMTGQRISEAEYETMLGPRGPGPSAAGREANPPSGTTCCPETRRSGRRDVRRPPSPIRRSSSSASRAGDGGSSASSSSSVACHRSSWRLLCSLRRCGHRCRWC
jgi:hypothetical protein